MTRTEYLSQLDHYLRKLPDEDYTEAIDYFTEYFDEAGPENENRVIEELGNPKKAAHDLMSRLLDEKFVEEDKSPKKRATIIWIAILAIFASPIAVPLPIAFVVVIFAFIIAGASLLLALMILGGTFLFNGIFMVWDSLTYWTISAQSAIFGVGLGILSFGLSLLAILASIETIRVGGQGLMSLTRWIIRKGRKS